MRKITRLFLGVVAVAGMVNCGSAMAQSGDAGAKFYRLDFVVKEVESGKVVNSRTYSTMVSTEVGHGRDGGSIRAGTRIPININSPDSKEPNVQYMDVGVNIDCSAVRMTNGQLSMGVTAEVSTLAMDPFRDGPGPVTRNLPMMPSPGRERGTSTQKDGADGPAAPPAPQAGIGEEPMPPPPPIGKGEQSMRIPPPGARTNMLMSSMMAPIIRQNRWAAVATVAPGKPTTLFASDDIASKRKTEVELTATEIR